MARLAVLVFFVIGFIVFSLVKSAKTGFMAAKEAVMQDEKPTTEKSFDDIKKIIYAEANGSYDCWGDDERSIMDVLNHSLKVTDTRLKLRGYLVPQKELAALVFLAIAIGNPSDRELLKVIGDPFLQQYGIDTSYYDGKLNDEFSF
ncbi:hypothetical protein DPQ33_17790 [Oceanidesulfovibrio indonesiensis]|uniref:Uncharacterized protein n=1 Tax=Oceanidesulfovibrio indonesiensis TaxID=54767 RepID=A0A7M3MA25_9BACT|nr:hypothetical protein [Oceanidesulfovibrio indonesiensis]TVM14165.1 hypothetical protein DPQ33_17790 [Oceanidesulfovibrio indonesiensis]